MIELEKDLENLTSFQMKRITWIDHHNERAGHDQPTSLEQVFQLLKLPQSAWTRRMSLVAANDRAHIRGMSEISATAAEMASIRLEDRRSQGVSEKDEAIAQEDLSRAEVIDSMVIVQTRLTSSTAIADHFSLHPDFEKIENLLVLMPNSSAFFGEGAQITKLSKNVPGSWYGGDLPEIGFWGSHESRKEKLLAILIDEWTPTMSRT